MVIGGARQRKEVVVREFGGGFPMIGGVLLVEVDVEAFVVMLWRHFGDVCCVASQVFGGGVRVVFEVAIVVVAGCRRRRSAILSLVLNSFGLVRGPNCGLGLFLIRSPSWNLLAA